MSARRPLYGWLTADAISLVGTRVSMIAIPWFVLTTTGSPTLTGLIALAEMLPLVVLKVLGGPVIDRVGARRVAITCDLGSVVVVGAIPLLHGADLLAFPVLLALVAVAGGLRGPGDAAKHALIPQLAATAEVPIERATGLSSTVERTATLLGAALAGALVTLVGAANALLVDAVSFGVAAAVLAWATVAMRPGRDVEEDRDPAPYLVQLREGWDFLRRDPVLLAITVMVALTNLLDAAWAAVLMPVWAKEYGAGAAGLGTVFAVFAGASALGSVCAAAWAARLPRFWVYLVAFLLAGAPRFAVFAYDSPAWLVGLVVVVGGFASGFLNPVLGAVIFERIPDPLLGRVSSLTTAMCWALMPFGGLLGGALVSWQGLTFAMLATGAAYFLVTMLPAVDPRWREIDRRPEPAPSLVE
ncbi:MFS transporter [Nocardioides sp. HM23]|uniref:MFS transporter n=1 Tax=Nocardioides bizhenqiangii TaxID=3095076 RepID=UPI002ACAB1A0|nr:MFS transporter [Nocardioides sp. HM23]MDZ5619377.1 MFS transporter [Nocardioides sp. HM23]